LNITAAPLLNEPGKQGDALSCTIGSFLIPYRRLRNIFIMNALFKNIP
jgi:hypothetical protein